MSQETEDAKYRLRGMFDAPTLQADRVIAATQALALHRIADALEPRTVTATTSANGAPWFPAWRFHTANRSSQPSGDEYEGFIAGWYAYKESK